MKRPKLWGFWTWLASAAAGIALLILADFGAPLWISLPLAAWLWTFGLPTLLATLLVASAWGRLPGLGLPSLGAALAVMAVLSLLFQVGAFLLLARVLRRRQAKAAWQ